MAPPPLWELLRAKFEEKEHLVNVAWAESRVTAAPESPTQSRMCTAVIEKTTRDAMKPLRSDPQDTMATAENEEVVIVKLCGMTIVRASTKAVAASRITTSPLCVALIALSIVLQLEVAAAPQPETSDPADETYTEAPDGD